MNDSRCLDAAANFTELMQLKSVGSDAFESTLSGPTEGSERPSIYGGQIAAQCLVAAGRTVDSLSRHPHAVHCRFTSPGDPALPIRFDILRDHDGNSFSSRRVTASQGGRPLCTVSAGFVADRGRAWFEQAVEAPPVESPTAMGPTTLGKLISFEGRVPGPANPRMERPARFWVRASDTLSDAPLIHASGLLYVSDVAPGSPSAPDGTSTPRASLDHAVWFHGPINLNDWLLVDLTHVLTARGRTFYDGRIFDSGGALIGSVTQEELFY
ncbi:acyl-CoA thioesterase [Arthrobacter sp. NyZ413]|uniref:acyl-CoA thioesterase n=1 Tax=Arthrobacter sp. NyZ413 TaxID=3144669 RepID=UPI003BF864A3